MKPSRQLVRRLTRRLFPGRPEARVFDVLDRYGTEPHECERDRVHVAVLKLSAGNWERLAEMVALAKTDYRDALAAAEYPGQSRATRRLEPPAEERIRRQDRRQYLDWVRRHVI